MATDIYIDYKLTGDIEVVNGQMRLTESKEELTRQRLEITLKTFKGEWFKNILFGTPYFQEIFGRSEQDFVDLIFEDKILSVDGVQGIEEFVSTLDKKTRAYTLTFKAKTDSGEIVEVSVVV